jgi:hypothetical protein
VADTSALARLRGILAATMTRDAIDHLLDQAALELIRAAGDKYVQAIRAQAEAAIEQARAEADPVHALGDDAARLRATLLDVRRDLAVLYGALPEGLDAYLARIRITRLRIDKALAEPDDAAEQPIPYSLVEPARCCMCGSTDVRYRNYREQPFCWPCADGTSPEGKAAVAASLAEPNPVVRAADQPQPAVAGSRASEIYTGPGSVGDVLARAFRATWQRGR